MSSQHLRELIHCHPPVQVALEQLLEARRGAELLQLDVWTMAVEASSLLTAGCTTTQLRLLVGAGFVEHAEDVTRAFDKPRTFQPESPMKFGPQTCFVLTDAGVQFLKTASSDSERGPVNRPHIHSAMSGMMGRQVPCWDAEARALRVHGRLVKQFHRPAPMLELVLAGFEELGWPPHLDDPLPPEHEIVPEERLRDTVRRLNRCQEPFVIRFESDGLGAGIRWNWAGNEVGEPTEEPRKNHGVREENLRKSS